METNIVTQLTRKVNSDLLKEKIKLINGMEKEGFKILKSKLFNYGCSIHFILGSDEGWIILYKNNNNRTTFNFNFIVDNLAISKILRKIKLKNIARGEFRKIISSMESRRRIRWYLRKVFR